MNEVASVEIPTDTPPEAIPKTVKKAKKPAKKPEKKAQEDSDNGSLLFFASLLETKKQLDKESKTARISNLSIV
jgi:hypothetical protein